MDYWSRKLLHSSENSEIISPVLSGLRCSLLSAWDFREKGKKQSLVFGSKIFIEKNKVETNEKKEKPRYITHKEKEENNRKQRDREKERKERKKLRKKKKKKKKQNKDTRENFYFWIFFFLK